MATGNQMSSPGGILYITLALNRGFSSGNTGITGGNIFFIETPMEI